MKVNIDIDMTPEEARKMMGLPDLEPIQKAMMDKLQAHMEEYFTSMSDPEVMFNKLMPMGIQAMETYQNFYREVAKASMPNPLLPEWTESVSNQATNSAGDTMKLQPCTGVGTICSKNALLWMVMM